MDQSKRERPEKFYPYCDSRESRQHINHKKIIMFPNGRQSSIILEIYFLKPQQYKKKLHRNTKTKT